MHRTNIVIYTWSCDTLWPYAPYKYRDIYMVMWHPMTVGTVQISWYIHGHVTPYVFMHRIYTVNTLCTIYTVTYMYGTWPYILWFMIPLPKIPYIHCIYIYIYLWPTISVCVSLTYIFVAHLQCVCVSLMLPRYEKFSGQPYLYIYTYNPTYTSRSSPCTPPPLPGQIGPIPLTCAYLPNHSTILGPESCVGQLNFFFPK